MGLTAAILSWYNSGNAIVTTRQALEDAKTYQEYQNAALMLDFLEGRNKYKAEPFSIDYDSALISARMAQLRTARLENNFSQVQFLLRTTLSRNLGNMGNASLYACTHIGTKFLIEEYISEVQSAFQFLLDHARTLPEAETQEVLNSLLKTRQAFGRTALLLSGGGTLGMMHIGVVKTLFDARLLPRIINGSSAGAIVAAIVCTRKDEEMAGLVEKFPYGNLQVFEHNDRPESMFTRLGRFLKHGVVMDIQFLRTVMEEWMGNMTFSEAFNKTRRILNITVSSSSIYEMPRLLNYITAPNVIIWSAVAASCSIPGVFAGSPLLAKDAKTGEPAKWDAGSSKCIDGSIDGDLPTTRLSELFNVNHFIVSQVNPHVTMFLPSESHELENAAGLLPTMIMNELLHVSEVVTALGIAPAITQRISGILKQRYIGNITILPSKPLLPGLYRLLTNPTPAFMLDASGRGERATWKRMSLIKNHFQIESTIDTTLNALRLTMISQTRPTRFLKSSESASNFGHHGSRGRHHHRRRSSIISNTSVELDPSDLAPTRAATTSTTPRFEASGYNWDTTTSPLTSRRGSRLNSRDGSSTHLPMLLDGGGGGAPQALHHAAGEDGAFVVGSPGLGTSLRKAMERLGRGGREAPP